tara:strand:- start:2408 stop:3706 length:1299 start_codon:yes stop_codon:yes gene_type:complete
MAWQQILQTYDLNEFIIKAPAKKAKKAAGEETVGRDTVKVISSGSLAKVTKDIQAWKSKCSGLSGEAIGVTGRGAEGNGKNTLLEHVLAHVDESVQRTGAGAKDGAMDIVAEILEIADADHAFKEKELRMVDRFIQDLKDVENDDDTNPRNIPFDVPEVVTRDGAESWHTVRGHYRTPEYVDYRKNHLNKDGEMKAVDDSWYKTGLNEAQPPFWQALYNRSGSGLVGEGLLPLLERFKEEMEEQELDKLHVKGKFQRQSIENVPSFINSLLAVLRTQEVYKSPSEPFKRLHLNFAAIKRALQAQEFLITSERESDFVKKVTGHDDLVGELKSFFVDNISIQLLRTIIKNNINLDTFKHGQYTGIFLRDPIRVQDERKVLFNREKKKAKKEGKLPFWIRDEEPPSGGSGGGSSKKDKKEVKKSWSRTLWRGLE